MKWAVLNALGGLIWIAGLCLAKGATLPVADLSGFGDHRLAAGLTLGCAGLLLLLWTNLRSAA